MFISVVTKQQEIIKWLIYIVKKERKTKQNKKTRRSKMIQETSILVTNGFENIIGIIFSDHFSNLTELMTKAVENKRY